MKKYEVTYQATIKIEYKTDVFADCEDDADNKAFEKLQALYPDAQIDVEQPQIEEDYMGV